MVVKKKKSPVKKKVVKKIENKNIVKVENDKPLTPRTLLFCKEFIVDFVGTNAAIRAGFTKNSAHSQSTRMLKNAKVQAEIRKGLEKKVEKIDLTAEKVLDEICKLAFSNIKNLYDKQGKLIPIHLLDSDITACLQEVTEDSVKIGENSTVTKIKYKMSDKKANLELLGRYFSLFQDNVNHKISGGLLIVPGMATDEADWEKRVMAAQKKLAEGK